MVLGWIAVAEVVALCGCLIRRLHVGSRRHPHQDIPLGASIHPPPRSKSRKEQHMCFAARIAPCHMAASLTSAASLYYLRHLRPVDFG
jgi:hypothetical protein